jgi:hypothetical protein
MIKKASFPHKLKIEVKVIDKEGRVVNAFTRET